MILKNMNEKDEKKKQGKIKKTHFFFSPSIKKLVSLLFARFFQFAFSISSLPRVFLFLVYKPLTEASSKAAQSPRIRIRDSE